VLTHGSVEEGLSNVAIGIIDEPTFVGKSKILQQYFAQQHSSSPTQLSFLVGMDTLERLFSPKYYPPPPDQQHIPNDQVMLAALSQMFSPEPQGDDSLVVCARRSTVPSDISQDVQGESGLDHTIAIASKAGWLKARLGDGHQSAGTEEGAQVQDDERITLIEIGDQESRFSSTAVRKSRASKVAGEPWRNWVTKRIAAYIQNKGLYLL